MTTIFAGTNSNCIYKVIKELPCWLLIVLRELWWFQPSSRQSLDQRGSILHCHPTTHQFYQGASGWCFASMARWHQPEHCTPKDSFATFLFECSQRFELVDSNELGHQEWWLLWLPSVICHLKACLTGWPQTSCSLVVTTTGCQDYQAIKPG